MLNTRSMSNAFRNWCDQNNLTGVLNKYLEADGTIKQRYVFTDSGVEHNIRQCPYTGGTGTTVLTNQQMTMRVNNAGNGTELQWSSPVTILHSLVTMTVENEASFAQP
eukprot:6459820-Amphidinium_carterae.1